MYEKIVTQVGPLSCVLYTGQPYILVSTLSALTCVHIHTVRIVGIMARIMASRSKGIRKRGGREAEKEKEQGEQIEESRERGNIAPCIVW